MRKCRNRWQCRPAAPGYRRSRRRPDRSVREHDRHLARRLQQRHQRRVSIDHDGIRCQRDQLRHAKAQKFVVVRTRRCSISMVRPRSIQLLQTLTKGCHASLPFRIVRRSRGEHPDPPHALGLLRARRERPRRCRAAEQRDELAARLIRSPRRRGRAASPAPRGRAWRRLQVDDQLELGRLHDRQVGGLRALEDAAGIDADLTKGVR